MITAALSIQDPRERPVDKQEAADASHRRFADPTLGLPDAASTCGTTWRTGRTRCPPAPSAGCAAPSSCTTCGSASGRTCTASCAASCASSGPRCPGTRPRWTRRRSPARCWPACCRTWACARTPARARGSTPGPAGRALRRLAGQRAGQAAAALGRGGRAGRDLPAVGPYGRQGRAGVGRGARRPPGRAHLQRAALVQAPRRGGRHRAGHAVRPADRGRPHGRLRADRPGAVPRAVPAARAGRGRLAVRQHQFLAANRAAARRRRGAGAPDPAARAGRRRRRAVRLLRRPDPRRRGLRRGTSTRGGSRPGGRTRTCSRSPGTC